jgi:hypothetical protein
MGVRDPEATKTERRQEGSPYSNSAEKRFHMRYP